jgi:NitT/TauT family transport system substrate-binding protein
MDARLRVTGLLLALAVLLGACSSAAPAPSPAPAAASAPPAPAAPASTSAPTAATGGAVTLPPRPDRPVAQVTIGVLNTSSDVVFFYPEEKGWFEYMRIDPILEPFDSGGRMVSALATNQIQVGGGSPSVGLYNAIARGVDVKLVADRASGVPGYILFVRKGLADTIRDEADLRGRRIAIAVKGTTAEVVVGKALEKGGLTMADAEIVELPYPDMVAAMATGVIDVGVAPEPSPTIAIERGLAVKWRRGSDIARQQGSILMYTGAFIEEQTDVARDFMIAYLLGVRAYHDAFFKKLPEVLAPVRDTVLRRTVLKDPALLDRIDTPHMDPNGAIERVGLLSDYEWFREYGGLTETIDFNQIIDERFVQNAVAVLGPYR